MSGAVATSGPGAVIRYMGNKRASLPSIRSAVERLAPGGAMVVDPMAGSHAVTRALKDRHRILGSDAQQYSAVIGRAFVDNTSVPTLEADLVTRLRRSAESAFASETIGFLEESFSETYLGRRQCRQLDALRAAVDKELPGPDDPRRDLALCALMTAACRGQATPGHFAQFLRPDHPRTRKLREVNLFAVAWRTIGETRVEPGRLGSRTRALPWRAFVEGHAGELGEAALWYLDPPYTRDQYSRFYHFLETLVLGDRPRLEHRARYRDDRFRSAFCSPRRAPGECADLFAAIREHSPNAAVLLSYSARGLLSHAQLVEGAAPGFRLEGLEELVQDYSTQGKGRLNGVREWLLSFRPV